MIDFINTVLYSLAALLLVGCFLLVAVKVWLLFRFKSKVEEVIGSSFSYKKAQLFSPAELNFYRVLVSAVGDGGVVLAKVRQADLLQPDTKGSSDSWRGLFNKIQSKHFDFVLCDPQSMEVLCAIELDDSSHNKKSVRARDEFVEQACKSAGLDLERFKAKRSYSVESIAQQLKPYIVERMGTRPVAGHADSQSVKRSEKYANNTCERCGSEVVKRKLTKGSMAGRYVWYCHSNAECKHISLIPVKRAVRN